MAGSRTSTRWVACMCVVPGSTSSCEPGVLSSISPACSMVVKSWSHDDEQHGDTDRAQLLIAPAFEVFLRGGQGGEKVVEVLRMRGEPLVAGSHGGHVVGCGHPRGGGHLRGVGEVLVHPLGANGDRDRDDRQDAVGVGHGELHRDGTAH